MRTPTVDHPRGTTIPDDALGVGSIPEWDLETATEDVGGFLPELLDGMCRDIASAQFGRSLRMQGISPEMILTMLRMRLRDLDMQVINVTRDIERATNEAERLGGEISELRALQQELEWVRDRDGNYNFPESVVPAPPDGWQDAHPGQDYGRWLHALKSRLDALGVGRRDEALQRRIDGLGEQQRQVNSGNEMRMVQMQSLMQQRTSMIQLGSNLLKAIDEATDSVVGNLR